MNNDHLHLHVLLNTEIRRVATQIPEVATMLITYSGRLPVFPATKTKALPRISTETIMKKLR